jgi:hypothetical protein
MIVYPDSGFIVPNEAQVVILDSTPDRLEAKHNECSGTEQRLCGPETRRPQYGPMHHIND